MPQIRNEQGQFVQGGTNEDAPVFYGENHPAWKGDQPISYEQLHKWAAQQFNHPGTCWLCEKPGRIDMACINGTYTRVGATWAALCVKCHRLIDGHPYRRKLSDDQIARVRTLHSQGHLAKELARQFGVSARTIHRVCHLDYPFLMSREVSP